MHRALFSIFLALLSTVSLGATTLFNSAAPDATNTVWEARRGAVTDDDAVRRGGKTSVRVEPRGLSDAWVLSPPVQLTPGRRYTLRGWVKTDGIDITESGRTPIAVGAALTMASMPYDVHSASVGATTDWTRLELSFTATQASDRIALTVGQTGYFRGRAWFEGVTLDEASARGALPDPATVRSLGPAYRYPEGGWIYLHIEGAPYDRGYQHGFLMGRELVSYMKRCVAALGGSDPKHAWEQGRTMANALFLRGFDQEILEEMRGIADGANAAGVKFDDRPLDLVDVVTVNTLTEIQELRSALPMTPTGLEKLNFAPPAWGQPNESAVPVTARCSAFAAAGKATRGGRMVIGHITMWSLTLAEQVNLMLDVKPAKGHRVLMQAYPGGIQSGMDWYQNDAGMVLTETTIEQSPFNVNGTPIAYRARRAIQYGTTVDEVGAYLLDRNNGLYTNEWLIGDAKNNQIGMLELGTNRTKFYHSAQGEWFGGTEGFYWGCNNAKDQNVRLDYQPDPQGKPAVVQFEPKSRDVKWLELYERFQGQIDTQFGFLAFRTAPLVTATSFDAKVVDSDMVQRQMVWAQFGKPNQREWVPSEQQKKNYEGNEGIYSSGYRLFSIPTNDAMAAELVKNGSAKRGESGGETTGAQSSAAEAEKRKALEAKLWKGWLLPATEADKWFTSGSAAYYSALSDEHPERKLESYRVKLRGVQLHEDKPLAEMTGDLHSLAWSQIEAGKGALFLDAIRAEMGDDAFFKLMREFFATNTTKAVSATAFLRLAQQASPKVGEGMIHAWLHQEGIPGDKGGPLYLADVDPTVLTNALIVYGTTIEAGANRYAAERVQAGALNLYESRVPIKKDFEVTEEDLRVHDLLFVGRPESNVALSAIAAKMGLDYGRNAFTVDGKSYGSEEESLLFAAANPWNAKRKVLVIAGNSALATVRAAKEPVTDTQFAVYREGKQVAAGFSR